MNGGWQEAGGLVGGGVVGGRRDGEECEGEEQADAAARKVRGCAESLQASALGEVDRQESVWESRPDSVNGGGDICR